MRSFSPIRGAVPLLCLSLSAVVGACGGNASGSKFDDSESAGASAQGGGAQGGDGQAGGGAQGGKGGAFNAGGAGGGVQPPTGDPNTCEGAASLKSYVGCDYWPTVTANNVWSSFDFAVIVANAGNEPADVEVEQGGTKVGQTVTVAPNSLEKIYLPWVPALKGGDADSCGTAKPLGGTLGAVKGAYHLTSTRPVTVYQFNALEYKGAGGPPGKSWASCAGNKACDNIASPSYGTKIGCFSFSNDASILLPSTAMTGNYRVTIRKGWPAANMGAYMVITGTADGTQVKVKLSGTAKVLGGAGIAAAGAGAVVSFTVNKGDVLELVGEASADLSGSLVQATAPVQVLTGMPCAQAPDGVQACDHLEETVFPAETLGKRYFVSPMTGPRGNAPGHIVRIYGNVDGTQLTYKPSKPANAPSTINAGQVVELSGTVKTSFEVEGDHEFAVGTFMPGAEVLDPSAGAGKELGDPSMSMVTAVEQFRTKYVFLAPDDYDVSYADLLIPDGASVKLDGAPITAKPTAISSGFGVARVKLGAGQKGAHTLESDKPVGLQVMGYGSYTSYQYPGGLNLIAIAPPPPDIE